MFSASSFKNDLKEKARKLGFDSVGIAKTRFLEEEKQRLIQWLEKGYHGEMDYMERNLEKRLDPRRLVENAKSVIVLSHSYYPKQKQPVNTYQIAKYAYGKDYHSVLRTKLYRLVAWMQEQIGEFNYRVFTDSAPVLEREWGVEAGLGWRGKNSLLLQPQKGSFFFLAEIILDKEMDYDEPFQTDMCGRCTRCIDACPTQAIIPDERMVDATKCISYWTIEYKGEKLPDELKGKWQDWIFGCDICQDVCPWNKFSIVHNEPEFEPHPRLLEMSKADWENLTEEEFREIFRKSAVKRTKYKGLMRNINFLKDNES